MFRLQLRTKALLLCASFGLSLLTARLAYAQQPQPVPLAVSTFDVDAEGWTVTGDAQGGSPIPNYFPSGGNPGGYISATDDETGGIWYWQAPAKFLGNIAEAYGQVLRFDLRQSALTQQRDAPDVVLKGPGGTFYYDTPNNPDKVWTPYTVVLSETSGWTKSDGSIPTQAEMKALLSNVDTLRIRGEYRSAADTGDIDNVVLERVKTPSAQLVTPVDGAATGPDALTLAATLSNPSNYPVTGLEFLVLYDGVWHSAGVDATAPYEVFWQAPAGLRSQKIQFNVRVNTDPAGTVLSTSTTNTVDYVESLGNPSVVENWVPQRAYLNQRPLAPAGDQMPSVASMAMVLAMNGIIPSDQATMSAKAMAMFSYPNVLDAPYPAGNAVTTRMAAELVAQGMVADDLNLGADSAWTVLKLEIDSGRPVLLRAYHGVVTKLEHAIVAVGYRETVDSRRIVVYDPYGAWQGTRDGFNANDRTDPLSDRGQWASYDFGTVYGPSNHLIIARPAALTSVSGVLITSAPDMISEEVDNSRSYEGVTIVAPEVYIPYTRK